MSPTIPKKYSLVPLPKTPYWRLGPFSWQDYYRQLERTVEVARQLVQSGNEVIIAIISAFQPPAKASEAEIYRRTLYELAPELTLRVYKDESDTVGQIERTFNIADEMAAKPVFIATWMHYPRVRYLARRRPARHYGAFGIPQPAFLFMDPIFLIFQPIGDFVGLTSFFRKAIIRARERGRIL